METEILGVDIGRVIIDGANEGTDTSFFSQNYLDSIEVEHAVEVLAELRAKRFHDRIWLVSKCYPNTQERTRHWLEHQRFFERTGIPNDHLRFCLKWFEKAPICRELGITHFVDDRLDILGSLETVPRRYLFRPTARTLERTPQFLPLVHRVESWLEIRNNLLSTP